MYGFSPAGSALDFCVTPLVLALRRRWKRATREPALFEAALAEHLGIKDGGSFFLINQSYISIKEFKFIHINNSCTYYATHSECTLTCPCPTQCDHPCFIREKWYQR